MIMEIAANNLGLVMETVMIRTIFSHVKIMMEEIVVHQISLNGQNVLTILD